MTSGRVAEETAQGHSRCRNTILLLWVRARRDAFSPTGCRRTRTTACCCSRRGDRTGTPDAMPLAFLKLMRDPKINWGYLTEPEPGANGRRIPLPRGKVLGGTSSINGMLYSRGHPRRLRPVGADGRSRGGTTSTSFRIFAAPRTAGAARAPITGAAVRSPFRAMENGRVIFPATMETARRLGYPVTDDHHGEITEGFAPPEFTVHKAFAAARLARYLRPATGPPEPGRRNERLVVRILIEKRRADGVEYRKNGDLKRSYAAREAILSGGHVQLAAVLLLSGIGPADELKAAGITAPARSAGCRQEFAGTPDHGHRIFSRRTVRIRIPGCASIGWRWRLCGGSFSIPDRSRGCRSPAWDLYARATGLERPDIKANFYPTGIDFGALVSFRQAGQGARALRVRRHFAAGQPRQRDTQSNDPAAAPVIRLNLFRPKRATA